jgi:hypothetical protein
VSSRKDDLFSISVTELLLIIMFALLIVMILLNTELKNEVNEQKNVVQQFDNFTKELEHISRSLGLPTVPQNPASLELNEAVAQMQALVKALKASVESEAAQEVLAKMKLNDVWTSLTKVSEENLNIPSLLATVKEVNEELQKCLDELSNTKEQLSKARELVAQTLDDKRDIEKELQEYKSELINVKKENNNLIGQVENLSNGLEFPPCWATPEGKPQYTYLVEVHDNSILVSSVYPEERKDAYFELMALDYNRQPFTIEEFRATFQLFYQDAVKRVPECRYFVKVQDATSPDSKREYKTGLKAVESIFYKYLMQ